MLASEYRSTVWKKKQDFYMLFQKSVLKFESGCDMMKPSYNNMLFSKKQKGQVENDKRV